MRVCTYCTNVTKFSIMSMQFNSSIFFLYDYLPQHTWLLLIFLVCWNRQLVLYEVCLDNYTTTDYLALLESSLVLSIVFNLYTKEPSKFVGFAHFIYYFCDFLWYMYKYLCLFCHESCLLCKVCVYDCKSAWNQHWM